MKITFTTDRGIPLALSNLIIEKGMSVYDIEDVIEDAVDKGLSAMAIATTLNNLHLDTRFEANRTKDGYIRLRGKDLFGNVRYLIIRK